MAEESRPSFEENLERMQAVVTELEGGNLSLEKSLELFTQGVELLRECRQQLEEAEQKVELLVTDAEGNPERQPLAEGD